MKQLIVLIISMLSLTVHGAVIERVKTQNTVTILVKTNMANNQKDIDAGSEKVLDYLKKNNIEPTGPRYSHFKITITDPAKEPWIMEVGYPVAKPLAKADGEFTPNRIPEHDYGIYQTEGKAFEEIIPNAYDDVRLTAKKSVKEIEDTSFHFYLTAPKTATSQIKYKILIPIKMPMSDFKFDAEKREKPTPAVAIIIKTDIARATADTMAAAAEVLKVCKAHNLETVGAPFFHFKTLPTHLALQPWMVEVGYLVKTPLAKADGKMIPITMPPGEYLKMTFEGTAQDSYKKIDDVLGKGFAKGAEWGKLHGSRLDAYGFIFNLLPADAPALTPPKYIIYAPMKKN